MEVLVTCPPMITQLKEFQGRFEELGWNVHAPDFKQVMSEAELIALLPKFDLWIIGDDPASAAVVRAGAEGSLKAAVRWGVGVDNVDFEAFEKYGIPVTNTPGMFGNEVADIALGYVIGLARSTFEIDRAVKDGGWPKPTGISLAGKNVAVVGFGDIGKNTAKRLTASDMIVHIFDPFVDSAKLQGTDFRLGLWPQDLGEMDFIVFTCALTNTNRHMLNAEALNICKSGVFIVNVARGPLIHESALVSALSSGKVRACALDVFEEEPIHEKNPLLQFPANIFGSHNASNTKDAVIRTSEIAIAILDKFATDIAGKPVS